MNKSKFLTQAKSLGFLKNNFSIFTTGPSKKLCVTSNLNFTDTGKEQCKAVLDSLKVNYYEIEISTMFVGVKSWAFKIN